MNKTDWVNLGDFEKSRFFLGKVVKTAKLKGGGGGSSLF